MSDKLNLTDELALAMEDYLSGKIALVESKNIEKNALIIELKEGIELFEDINNAFGAKILEQVFSKIAKIK